MTQAHSRPSRKIHVKKERRKERKEKERNNNGQEASNPLTPMERAKQRPEWKPGGKEQG